MDWNTATAAARESFREAVNNWLSGVQLRGGTIAGPNLIIPAGSIGSSASIQVAMFPALMRAKIPPRVADVLARTLAGAWDNWVAGLQIQAPGAFAPFAAAPGMMIGPALPIPLAVSVSSGEASLQTFFLSQKLSTALRPFAAELTGAADAAIKALTEWVDASFKDWKRAAFLVGVRGQSTAVAAAPYNASGPIIAGQIFPQSISIPAIFGKFV